VAHPFSGRGKRGAPPFSGRGKIGAPPFSSRQEECTNSVLNLPCFLLASIKTLKYIGSHRKYQFFLQTNDKNCISIIT